MPENRKKPFLPINRSLLGWVIPIALLMTILWNRAQLSWHELYWLLFPLTAILVRQPFSVQTKDNTVTVDESSCQEQVLMLFLFITTAPLPMLFLAGKSLGWDVLGFADYPVPETASVIGALILFPFAVLFWRSHKDLGKNWSAKLEMHEEHTLVTDGVYRFVRHPMYSAIWLMVIAQPLLLHNWLGGFLAVPAFFAVHVLRIPKEEAMMIKKFGNAYTDYAENTGRVLPRIL